MAESIPESAKKKNLRLRKILFAGVLGLIILSVALAVFRKPAVDAPPDIKQLRNPVPPSDTALRQAGAIYKDKCANCHGDSGKGDGTDAMMYDPQPADFTDPRHMRKFTDGDLFYRITVGKKPMPAFEKKLSEEQRWQLVLLVRSFATPSQP